jgi:hypothetical protein
MKYAVVILCPFLLSRLIASYHNRTIRGPIRHAQEYLNKVLRERDLGRHGPGSVSARLINGGPSSAP